MTKPIALEPTLVANSYDYTSPQTISNQDQPVWILPVKNTGWQKGGIAGDGSWYSGQYRSYIVKPGYWATQEEATMSGRPYLVNNQTVIPSPSPEGAPSTNPGAQELDITQTNSRLDRLEQANAQNQANTRNPDADAAQAARIQALATLANHQVSTDVDTINGSDLATPSPTLTVPATHHHAVKRSNSEETSPSSMPAGAKRAVIHYDTATTGSVIVDGHAYPFTLQHPGDAVTIQIPGKN